jgi:hypothetical protein
MRKISARREKKKKNSFFFFLFFSFLGCLQIDRLLREETVVFAVELDEVESTRAAAASGDDRKKDRETEVGERRLMAASAAKRERRLKEIFSAEGHCSAERNGRDVGCHQASSYKCIPSFTQPTLSFTRLYPPVFALLEFETDDSSHLRSTVNRHNKVLTSGY